TGKHYRCDNLWVRPKPLQRPHPPIRVGITSEVTFPLVGRLGFPIIINPSRVFALSELAPYIKQYRAAWHAAGHAGAPQVGLRVPLYVATTAERAYAEPRASTMAAMQGLGRGHHRRLERSGPTRPKHELRRLAAGQGGLRNAGEGGRSASTAAGRAGPDADPVRGQPRAPASLCAAAGESEVDQRARHSATQVVPLRELEDAMPFPRLSDVAVAPQTLVAI